ncbi:helicase-related protein [Sulfurovum sp.]|uniref:helicase-related protein n=1 Tax=Sulfurovum sp. TaxID=1969726 RepID=UPI0028680519|nr:helicase-related protein [Sulfurovum sp.]
MSEQKDIPKEEIYYDQRSVALRTTQSVYFVQEHDKISMLGLLLNEHKGKQVVVVVKSKKKADVLSAFLTSKEFKATSVHGNHRHEQQQKAATEFNQGTLNIIITTDMILKTMALENIKLVVSYDLPDMPQYYYNRLAFMKELGEAIALISPEDEPFLSDIEFNMKKEIEEKIVEGFVASAKPNATAKQTKDRTKKPRHRKNKVKKEI